MSSPARIMWSEGLFLKPQHLQQQDRYNAHRVHDATHALHPYAWGVRHLEVDTDALQDGILRLAQLRLMFRDGESLRAPGADPLPAPLRLDGHPPEVQSLLVYAALPLLKPQGGNASGADARYVNVDAVTHDLYSDAAEVPVPGLRLAVRLLTERDPLDSFETLPILRLRRTGAAGFAVDPEYIPPSVSVAAAGNLPTRLARLMEKLLAKVNQLYGHHRDPGRQALDLRGSDISSFWLLHTASGGYASLQHVANHPDLHPERLFGRMLALAGSLMAYSRTYTLEALPAYQHADPGPAFAQLDTILRDLLDTVISARYFNIPLQSTRPHYYGAPLEAERIDEHTALYLAVNADMPALELVEAVPLRFKAGAPDDVDKLVVAALPGIPLRHLAQVPSAIPVRPDTHYFALENRGPLYDTMRKAQAISIYVPQGMQDLRLELVAVTA